MSNTQKYAHGIILPSCRYSRLSSMPVGCKTACHFGQRISSQLCFFRQIMIPLNGYRHASWSVKSMVADGNAEEPQRSGSDNRPRLVREIRSFQVKLNARIEKLRKDWPMKILFFLIGFYCATAFATVIGQTGDWDILSAGLAVVVVEGIGALMYKASLPLLEKLRRLITMFNYWKAGLSLGLFLDAFKYEMDKICESRNPFNIDIDLFTMFW